jgi:hypothetical protein
MACNHPHMIRQSKSPNPQILFRASANLAGHKFYIRQNSPISRHDDHAAQTVLLPTQVRLGPWRIPFQTATGPLLKRTRTEPTVQVAPVHSISGAVFARSVLRTEKNQQVQSSNLSLLKCDSDGPVPGLAAWIRRLRLQHKQSEAVKWAEDKGACELAEILENLEDFARFLDLSPQETYRVRQCGFVAAESLKQSSLNISPSAYLLPLYTSVSTPVTCTHRVASATHNDSSLMTSSEMAVPVRTETDIWDERELAAHASVDFDEQEVGPTHRQLKRPEPLRWATPPKERWRVNEKLLKSRVPTQTELNLHQDIRAQAIALQQTSFPENTDHQAKTPRLTQFDRLRSSFLEAHQGTIIQELGSGYKLVPADVSEKVQNRFVSTCSSQIPDYGYHGTRFNNIPAILEKGLLIPGQQSGIRVANGSVHGCGIYTGMPGQSWLSKGFCDSDHMLVCGIVDPQAAPPSYFQPGTKPGKITRPIYQGGHRNHHRPSSSASSSSVVPPRQYEIRTFREDDSIKVVGGARVLFKEEIVAPLFIAQRANDSTVVLRESAAVQVSTANANKTHMSDRGGRQQLFIKEAGETLWAPPEAVHRGWNERRMKRIYEAKVRQVTRADQRDAKFQAQQVL